MELIAAVVISTLGRRDWVGLVVGGVVVGGVVVGGVEGAASGAKVIGALVAASVTNSGDRRAWRSDRRMAASTVIKANDTIGSGDLAASAYRAYIGEGA